MGLHPATSALLRFFTYEHLPQGDLQNTAAACAALADHMVKTLPDGGPELSMGLRKLLEAKDCFVRAALVIRDGPLS